MLADSFWYRSIFGFVFFRRNLRSDVYQICYCEWKKGTKPDGHKGEIGAYLIWDIREVQSVKIDHRWYQESCVLLKHKSEEIVPHQLLSNPDWESVCSEYRGYDKEDYDTEVQSQKYKCWPHVSHSIRIWKSTYLECLVQGCWFIGVMEWEKDVQNLLAWKDVQLREAEEETIYDFCWSLNLYWNQWENSEGGKGSQDSPH